MCSPVLELPMRVWNNVTISEVSINFLRFGVTYEGLKLVPNHGNNVAVDMRFGVTYEGLKLVSEASLAGGDGDGFGVTYEGLKPVF